MFLDTYERTGQVLDGWLRALYGGRYGDLPAGLVTTICGQYPLSPNLWSDYLSVTADIPLEPFSDAEARQFLASKDIAEPSTVEVILTLSACCRCGWSRWPRPGPMTRARSAIRPEMRSTGSCDGKPMPAAARSRCPPRCPVP